MPVILPSFLFVAHTVSTIDLLIPLSKHPVLFLFLNFFSYLAFSLMKASHISISMTTYFPGMAVKAAIFLNPSLSAVPEDNLMLARILITFSLRS